MAHVHNALHHSTALQDAYRQAIGEADAEFTGLERAGETLTPVIDLWSLPEWAIRRGEVLYGRHQTVPAGGAGTFASLELVNPTNSGIIAVVFRIACVSGTLDVTPDSGAALGAVATTQGVALDTRRAILGPSSVCTLVQGALAGAATNLTDRLPATGGTVVASLTPYVLRPGTKLFMMHNTANTAIQGVVQWRERRAQPAELAVV